MNGISQQETDKNTKRINCHDRRTLGEKDCVLSSTHRESNDIEIKKINTRLDASFPIMSTTGLLSCMVPCIDDSEILSKPSLPKINAQHIALRQDRTESNSNDQKPSAANETSNGKTRRGILTTDSPADAVILPSNEQPARFGKPDNSQHIVITDELMKNLMATKSRSESEISQREPQIPSTKKRKKLISQDVDKLVTRSAGRQNPKRKSTANTKWRPDPILGNDTPRRTRSQLRNDLVTGESPKIFKKRRKTIDNSFENPGMELGTILRTWTQITDIHKELHSTTPAVVEKLKSIPDDQSLSTKKKKKLNKEATTKKGSVRKSTRKKIVKHSSTTETTHQSLAQVVDMSGGILGALDDGSDDEINRNTTSKQPVAKPKTKRNSSLESMQKPQSDPIIKNQNSVQETNKALMRNQVKSISKQPKQKNGQRLKNEERGFLLYFRESKKRLKAERPKLSNLQLQEEAAKEWKQLSLKERQQYKNRSVKARAIPIDIVKTNTLIEIESSSIVTEDEHLDSAPKLNTFASSTQKTPQEGDEIPVCTADSHVLTDYSTKAAAAVNVSISLERETVDGNEPSSHGDAGGRNSESPHEAAGKSSSNSLSGNQQFPMSRNTTLGEKAPLPYIPKVIPNNSKPLPTQYTKLLGEYPDEEQRKTHNNSAADQRRMESFPLRPLEHVSTANAYVNASCDLQITNTVKSDLKPSDMNITRVDICSKKCDRNSVTCSQPTPNCSGISNSCGFHKMTTSPVEASVSNVHTSLHRPDDSHLPDYQEAKKVTEKFSSKYLNCRKCVGCQTKQNCGTCFSCVTMSDYDEYVRLLPERGHDANGKFLAAFRPICVLRVCRKPVPRQFCRDGFTYAIVDDGDGDNEVHVSDHQAFNDHEKYDALRSEQNVVPTFNPGHEEGSKKQSFGDRGEFGTFRSEPNVVTNFNPNHEDLSHCRERSMETFRNLVDYGSKSSVQVHERNSSSRELDLQAIRLFFTAESATRG